MPRNGSKRYHWDTSDYVETNIRRTVLTQPTFMPAHKYHTIYVPAGESAAWLVWEGTEDPQYVPITLSNMNLTQFSFAGLYQPMTPERLKEDLAMLHGSIDVKHTGRHSYRD